jgi:signal transduction histidine kinase
MKERVSQVGGALVVQSNENGTSVLVKLPIVGEQSGKNNHSLPLETISPD